jgi:hypothetical protein
MQPIPTRVTPFGYRTSPPCPLGYIASCADATRLPLVPDIIAPPGAVAGEPALRGNHSGKKPIDGTFGFADQEGTLATS